MKKSVRGALALTAGVTLLLAPGFVGSAQAASPAKARASVMCAGHKATIVSSRKVINGTKKSDVIVVRGAGTHIVNAGAGNDIVCASNSGTNILNGGLGNDTLVSGKASNVLDGNAGKDTFITKLGCSVVHKDVTDKVIRSRTSKDSFKDDSHWDNASIPADVRDTLATAGAYLNAGVLAGDVTGTGLQAALPDAPSVGVAPQSTILTNVMWNVTSADNVINGHTCVEASKDGVLFFKFVGHIEDGQTKGYVRTGKCMTVDESPKPSAALTDVLNAGRDQMFLAISTGTITGHGDQTVLPDVSDKVTPNSPFIKRVLWEVKSVDHANFCISATEDGSAFFSFEGHVRGDQFRGHIEGGQCEADNEHGHGPKLGADTGAFLLAARDFMNAGIVGGFITGSGSQATFPAGDPDTTVPAFAGLTAVRWQVKSGSPVRGRYCVAAIDTASQRMFRYLGHFEHGQPEGAITPGDCNFADEDPVPGFNADVAATLLGASGYLGTEIMLGELTGTGSQATMPGDATWKLGAFPATPSINHVEWNVTGSNMMDPAFTATFCVVASPDGTNVFHVAAAFDPSRGWRGDLSAGDCTAAHIPDGSGGGSDGVPGGGGHH